MEVMSWFCYFFYTIAIGYEVTDKVFDGLSVIQYQKEKLFYHPKQSVYGALLAFMIIGCLVSTARICLYIWKMFCINDCFSGDKDLVDRYNQYSVCVDAIKVIMEVFPQSIIAEFAFAGCPIETSNWKFLDIGFDVFCIASYVIFICSVSFWYMCCKECKIEKGTFTFFLTALATTFSKPGSAMAIISFSKSVKCP